MLPDFAVLRPDCACCYSPLMTRVLKNVLQTAEIWPAEAQEQLAQIACEIDAAVKGERYVATAEELRLIDEARGAVARGEVVNEQEAQAVTGGRYILTDDERRAINKARRGGFVQDAKVAAFWKRHGL